MVIDTACSLAFYCQCCGRIRLFDVPIFSGQRRFVMECANCGHKMGEITMRPKKGLVLKTKCGVCGGETQEQFSYRRLKRTRFEKLYCEHDNFELGYIGRWQDIAEFLDFNDAEYDALHPEESDDLPVGSQQTLLEALNRVHDLVRSGELACPCDSGGGGAPGSVGVADLVAGIVGDKIILKCQHCESYCIIPAHSKEDLEKLLPGHGANFVWRPHTFLDVWEK